MPEISEIGAFWSNEKSEVLERLNTTENGLSGEEARLRLEKYGANTLKPQKDMNALRLANN